MGDVFTSMLAGISGEGLTTTEISRRSGLSRQTIYRLRNGEGKLTSFETYRRLDNVYRATVPAAKRIVRTR